MQLDVSAPAVSGRGARSIRTQIVESALGGRVVDNGAVGIGQADVELVVNTRFLPRPWRERQSFTSPNWFVLAVRRRSSAYRWADASSGPYCWLPSSQKK